MKPHSRHSFCASYREMIYEAARSSGGGENTQLSVVALNPHGSFLGLSAEDSVRGLSNRTDALTSSHA